MRILKAGRSGSRDKKMMARWFTTGGYNFESVLSPRLVTDTPKYGTSRPFLYRALGSGCWESRARARTLFARPKARRAREPDDRNRDLANQIDLSRRQFASRTLSHVTDFCRQHVLRSRCEETGGRVKS